MPGSRVVRSPVVVVALAAALLTVPARRQVATMGKPGLTPVPCPTQEWQYADASFAALAGATAHFGRYEGGLYRIEIPESWNGELVLYAHGFVTNLGAQGSNLRVPNDPIRQHLVSHGFAWAASSYRCNGYVPGQGLLDTMMLVDLFTKANGGAAPRRTYLTGTSMGGHVTLLGMQEFPTSFAGGLAMCPAGPELFDFFAAVSAAAEVVTGVQFSRETLESDVAKMTEIVGTPPAYTDKGRQLASIEIQLSGGPRPFAMEGLSSRFIQNMSTSEAALVGSVTPGNRALTNSHIVYTIADGLGLTSEEVNRRVRRKAADPAIRNPDGPYEEVVPFDGHIARPTLTMHGTGDLFVPVFLEQTLKRAVIASGNQRLLVQRLFRIAGHCRFSEPEQIRAFDDLVKWVREGVMPEGDEVFGRLSDAGRRFTDPIRPNDPGGRDVPRLSAAP
jgi:pimeloyl-ACP methyl ester carboxylesterase